MLVCIGVSGSSKTRVVLTPPRAAVPTRTQHRHYESAIFDIRTTIHGQGTSLLTIALYRLARRAGGCAAIYHNTTRGTYGRRPTPSTGNAPAEATGVVLTAAMGMLKLFPSDCSGGGAAWRFFWQSSHWALDTDFLAAPLQYSPSHAEY